MFAILTDQHCILGLMLLTIIFAKSGRGPKVTRKSEKTTLVRVSQKDQLDSLVQFVGVG